MAKKAKSKPPVLSTFDPAEYLDSDEAIAAYIDEAIGTGDATFIASALGTVARARGMTEIAKETGLGRESLYKALSPGGNPELATFLKVMKALRLRVSVSPGERV